MDEFILPIDPDKFRSVNGAWNDLMLNAPWSVGYVTTLIELQTWKNKGEWEQFYYKNGEERKKLLGSNKALLDDYSLIRTNKSKIDSLSWDLKNLNFQHGRTIEDLKLRAQTLYAAVKDNGYCPTIEDCFESVRFHVICETWNGVILRENNTIKTLKSIFPNHIFEKTPGDIDYSYAVDYEISFNNKLLCGLQIKPPSYLGNAPYIQNARYANKKKNNAYSQLKKIPVWDVISKSHGEIQNLSVIEDIKKASD